MGKGQKTCPECGAINGARAFQCKECDYAFPNKYGRKRYNKPVSNWNDLKQGDCFRIVGGSGSYYVSPDTGERTYMSSKGKYIVNRITRDGILAYGIGKNNTDVNLYIWANILSRDYVIICIMRPINLYV